MNGNLIYWLWRFGYFYSPQALAVDLVDVEDLSILTLQDKVVQAAVLAAQEFNADVLDDTLYARNVLGRATVADGEPATAFLEMSNMPRCGRPDYEHPAAATMEGRYGPACLGELIIRHAFGDAVSEEDWKVVIRHLTEWIDGAEMRVDNDSSVYHFYEAIQSQRGGILAMHQLQSGVSCNATRGWFDPRAIRGSSGLRRGVLVHELTHGWGTGHTSSGSATMNPVLHSATQSRDGAYTEADKNLLRGVGYKILDEKKDPGDTGPKWDLDVQENSSVLTCPHGASTRVVGSTRAGDRRVSFAI